MLCRQGFLLLAVAILCQSSGAVSYDASDCKPSDEAVDGAGSMLQLKKANHDDKAEEEEELDNPWKDVEKLRKMHEATLRTRMLSRKPVRSTSNPDWLNSDCAITPQGIEAAGPCPADAKLCMFLKSTNTHIVPNPYKCYWNTGCNTKTLEGFCKCTGTPTAVGNVSLCSGTCLGGCAVWWQDITVVPNVCHKYESIEACKPGIVTREDKRVWPPQIVDNSMWKVSEDGEFWCNTDTLEGWCKCSGVPSWEMTTDPSSIYHSEWVDCKQHNKKDVEVNVIDFHPRTEHLDVESKKIPGGTGKCKWFKSIEDCAPVPYTPSAAHGWHEVANMKGWQSAVFYAFPKNIYQKKNNDNKFGPYDMVAPR